MLYEKINKYLNHSCVIYFILIAFLYPLGFLEYSTLYKQVFIFWLALALFLILLKVVFFGIKKLKDRVLLSTLVYFLTFILITFILQGTITEGLKKMIATPFLCLYLFIMQKENRVGLINSIINILIISFALNIFIFNSVFFP